MNASRTTVTDNAAIGTPTAIDWQHYMSIDPAILAGKPVVKGTRLGVEFVPRFFATSWRREQVLESYPDLTPEALSTVFVLAAELLAEETWSLLPPERPGPSLASATSA